MNGFVVSVCSCLNKGTYGTEARDIELRSCCSVCNQIVVLAVVHLLAIPKLPEIVLPSRRFDS